MIRRTGSTILSIQLLQLVAFDFLFVLLVVLTAPTTTLSFSINTRHSATTSLERFYRRRINRSKGRSKHQQQQQQKRQSDRIDNSQNGLNLNQTIVIDFMRNDDLLHNLIDHDEGRAENHVHESLMGVAIDQAKKAGKMGEVPIGAIVVKEVAIASIKGRVNSGGREAGATLERQGQQQRAFVILSNGQNQIETLHDASAHAELQAMRAAAYNIKNWRLINTTLYTTLEPCPMCLSAAQAFRVSKIVYGAPDKRLGAIETHVKLLDIAKHPFHDTMTVVSGVRGEECGQLLIDFFRERRKNKKKHIVALSSNSTATTELVLNAKKIDADYDKHKSDGADNEHISGRKQSLLRKLFSRLK